jgi:hypothetical protein
VTACIRGEGHVGKLFQLTSNFIVTNDDFTVLTFQGVIEKSNSYHAATEKIGCVMLKAQPYICVCFPSLV